MPAKKAVKAKKEEVIEIPKTALLADGKKTFFVGGWSAFATIAALAEATTQRDAGDAVQLLPGAFTRDAAAAAEPILVRSLTVVGVTAAELEKTTLKAPAAAAAGDEDGEEAAEAEEQGEAEDAAPAAAADPVVDQSVVVHGKVALAAYVPPVEIVPEVAAPEVAAAKPEPKGKKEKGKKAPTPAEEEKVVAPPPVEKVEEPVGAKPSEWPTLTMANVCFRGTLVVKGVHLVLRKCHFLGVEGDAVEGCSGNQLEVHQYCNVTATDCTFATPVKSSVYCYPCSNFAATGCVFSGADVFAAQQQAKLAGEGAAPDAALAALVTSSAAASKARNNVGVYCDNGAVTLAKCKFAELGVGLLLKDHCDGSTVTACSFAGLHSTGAMFDGSKGVFQDCSVKACGYYGLKFANKAAPKIYRNKLSAPVVIERGARPFLHSNTCDVRLVDKNDTGVVALEPKY
jgi:hypothetical protein